MWKQNIQDLFDILKPKPEQSLTATIGKDVYTVVPKQYGLEVGSFVAPQPPPAKPTLQVRTLTGLAAAVLASVDGLPGPFALHVIDHLTVAVIALEADEYGRRHEFIRATCQEKNSFSFNEYMVPEKFLIDLQSGFLPTDNVVQLQKLASSLTTENSVATADDGMAQVVTLKAGTVTRQSVEIPTRIDLYAYRTFREIDPTAGQFMVRLKGSVGSLPSIALLEVDAGKWKLTAMEQVASWLGAALPLGTIIIA